MPREAESDFFGLQNSFKAISGYQGGLVDKSLMAKKAADEKALREFVNSNAKLKQEFGDPWAEIDKAVGVQKEMFLPFIYVDNMAGFRGDLPRFARTIVRATAEKQKPSNQRIRGYQDSALPTLEQRLFSTAPVYKSLDHVQLAESLAEMQEHLGAEQRRSEDGARRKVAG